MVLEGSFLDNFIVYQNIFIQNFGPATSSLAFIGNGPQIFLSLCNYFIENFSNDANPSQINLITPNAYFPPGSGASTVGIKCLHFHAFYVSINDTYTKNFAYKMSFF